MKKIKKITKPESLPNKINEVIDRVNGGISRMEVRSIMREELESFYQRNFIIKIDKEWVEKFNSYKE